MYEVFCILPGTLTEDEARAKKEELHTVVSDAGAELAESVDLGRQRIAYPIAHQQHGYFYVLYCTATPEVVGSLRQRLERQSDLLRVSLRQFESGVNKKASTERTTTDVPRRTIKQRAERYEHSSVHREGASAPFKVLSVGSQEKHEVGQKEAVHVPVDLAAIDKKLDELLESDFAIDTDL